MSMMIGSGRFTPALTPYTKHRVTVLTTIGGDGYFSPLEVGLFGDWADSSYNSGTPSVSGVYTGGGTQLPASLIDGNSATQCIITMASGGWFVLDYGGTPKTLTHVYIQAPFSFNGQMPSSFKVEGWDGASWILLKAFTGIGAWYPGEKRWYAVADASLAPYVGKAREQRFRALTADDIYVSPCEARMFTTVGGSTNIAGSVISVGVIEGAPGNIVDSNNGTYGAFYMSQGGWFGWSNGHVPINLAAEFMYKERSGFQWQSPRTFVIETKLWGEFAVRGSTFTTGAWASLEQRNFTL